MPQDEDIHIIKFTVPKGYTLDSALAEIGKAGFSGSYGSKPGDGKPRITGASRGDMFAEVNYLQDTVNILMECVEMSSMHLMDIELLQHLEGQDEDDLSLQDFLSDGETIASLKPKLLRTTREFVEKWIEGKAPNKRAAETKASLVAAHARLEKAKKLLEEKNQDNPEK